MDADPLAGASSPPAASNEARDPQSETGSATITVNAANTFGNTDPVPIRAEPNRSSTDLGPATHAAVLTARCWVMGQTTTDGSNADPSDDEAQLTTDFWYGVDWTGSSGYISAAWTTKQETTLGLPGCTAGSSNGTGGTE